MADLHTTSTFTELENPVDIELSKPSKARYLFLLGFFGFFLFTWVGCYSLSTHAYKSNADVEVPASTSYNPKYKVD